MRRWLPLLVGAAALGARAEDSTLLFIAPANHTMPFVEIRDGQLQRGILKDLGEAIAARMGRTARFVVVPAKRVSAALARGEADGLCYTSPRWIDAAELHWSRPVFDYTGVVARRADMPPLSQLSQLAGLTLGTVAGYRYTEVEAALGPGFPRDDAPDMGRNLAKLAAGRIPYAMTEKLTLSYAMRENPQQGLQPALQTISYPTHCVFSPLRRLSLPAVDKAVDGLIGDGSVERLLARYR